VRSRLVLSGRTLANRKHTVALRGDDVAQERKAIRVIASVRRRVLAIGILVAAGAMATGMPGVRAAAHSVDFMIVSGKTPSGGGSLDFNGYQRGAMTITVPVGWEVVVHYENADPALPHSLAVLPAGAHQQVQPPATPAFPGATTASFATGLPKGSKQTFTFEASKAGTYEFVCGVQGHAVAGAWDAFVVSATADAPSVTPPGAATISVK
jgi:sulfocyanin